MAKAILFTPSRFVHQLAIHNAIPQTGFQDQQNTVQLVEDRTNEISVPIVIADGVASREMRWDDAANNFVANPGIATVISEFIKQLNKRYTGSAVLNNSVVVRAETIDAESGNRYVFTPGATVVGSLQDFAVIIPDQLGGYESRGFTLWLQTNANSNAGIDSGNVLLRLNRQGIADTWI